MKTTTTVWTKGDQIRVCRIILPEYGAPQVTQVYAKIYSEGGADEAIRKWGINPIVLMTLNGHDSTWSRDFLPKTLSEAGEILGRFNARAAKLGFSLRLATGGE